MSEISTFILDFKKYKINYIKSWILNRNIKLSKSTTEQKIFSKFICHFVLEKFYNISSSLFINKYGKPYLKNKNIFFNISHTSTKLIIAITDREIGIDIEYISFRKNLLKIAKRYFNKIEYYLLTSSNNINKDFYILWTLKEAQVKRNSLGISKGLNNANFNKINNLWISDIYPNDFITINYKKLIISICNKNIISKKINLFEVVNFKFKKCKIL